jgi:hypothetical protein
MDSWLIRAAARTIFSAARNSPSALTMLVFVNISFTHIIPNANQAAWLSGGLLKQSHPNAEVGHCGTIRAYWQSRSRSCGQVCGPSLRTTLPLPAKSTRDPLHHPSKLIRRVTGALSNGVCSIKPFLPIERHSNGTPFGHRSQFQEFRVGAGTTNSFLSKL